ncbi:MAG: hypothetical protein QNK36_07885 [Colwellia sp.]|nr:hypothetical protein [Colwellia sp.]
MRKIFILIGLLFLTGCGVNVNKICNDSGYYIYERVNLPPEYIKPYAPGMDKKGYEHRFGLNENYYIDRDKLEEDYIFTFDKREDLEGYKTWVLATDSIVRKSDGKLLAKQVSYVGYKADDKPFFHRWGHSPKDTSCPNGYVGISHNAKIFNSKNIVKDVFRNKDYTWTPESLLGSKSIRSGNFYDLCANTGIKIYGKEIIDESYLLPINKENPTHRVQGYFRYSNNQKYYFDIEKLQKEYTFTYRENQLVPSTKNTRVVRSTVIRKRDNKLIAEAISVHGRENDSYIRTTSNPNRHCSQYITSYRKQLTDIHDILLRSTFFKDDIDYQMFKLLNEKTSGSVVSTNTYALLLGLEEDMDFNQRLRFYKWFFPPIDRVKGKKIYNNKLISLYKNPLIDEDNMDVRKLVEIYKELINLALKFDDTEYIQMYVNKLISIYEVTLQNDGNMDLDQLVITYRELTYLSKKIDVGENLVKYRNKLLPLIKDNKKYSRLYNYIKKNY